MRYRSAHVAWFLALAICLVAFASISRAAQACTLSSSGPAHAAKPLTEAEKREARAFQADVRRSFPDHVQGAFHKAIAGNRSAIVVAEPPPHATAEIIEQKLGASFVEVVRRPVGHDGWSNDLVAIVDHQDGVALADSIVRLDAYLYGTSYRASLASKESRRVWQVPGLDLSVSPGELKRWIFGADARFASIDGAIAVTGADLQKKRARGVFRSLEPGLVVWAMPAEADLCEHQGELRQFVLEGDLVLAAIATAHHALIIGRERRASLEQFPPLRSESILALAATESPQLAQSYQRLALFSGKLGSGNDWAPILLSDELQGTELGSLLNHTDQMLKGWSLNGQVKYDGFDFYPQPSRWAAPQPIMDRLNTASLTFNWNTSGAVAVTQDGESVVLSVLRTGALPITYIPENKADARVAEFEASYHEYFATLGNPDLARVVAYTAMYEAVNFFRLKAACYKHGTGERKGEALLTARGAAFVDAVRKRDAALERDARAKLGPEGPKLLAQTKQYFDDVESKAGASSLQAFTYYLASVRGPHGVAKYDESLADQAEALANNEGFTALARATLNRDEVLKRFLEVARPAETRWLRTPTVVLSKAASAGGDYVEGGHNVDVRPFEIVRDENAPRRRPRVEALQGRSRVRVHPDDVELVRGLTPVLKKIEDGRVPAPAAEAEMAALLQAMHDTTPRTLASALWPGGEPLYWPTRASAGWSSARGPPAGTPPPAGRIRIERRQDAFELWLPAHDKPVRAESPISLSEKLNAFLTSSGQREVTLELVGMRDDQAHALRQTLRLQIRRLMAKNQKPPDTVEAVSGEAKGPPRTFDPKSAVVSIGEPRQTRGDDSPVYECQLEVRDKTLLMQALIVTKTKITEPVRAHMRKIAEGVVRRKKQSGSDAARAIRAVLEKDYKDIAVDVMVKDGDACKFVIANR